MRRKMDRAMARRPARFEWTGRSATGNAHTSTSFAVKWMGQNRSAKSATATARLAGGGQPTAATHTSGRRNESNLPTSSAAAAAPAASIAALDCEAL